MSNKRIGVVITIVIVLVASGCSTKKYVSKEVGAVNQKVETLSESVERNQERIGRNTDEISRHGGEIQRADAKADEAGQLAASAHDEAENAFNVAQKAMKGKLIYEITLSNDKVNFAFNASELSPDAQTLVDELADRVKADNRGLWIEVEGHTDATGEANYKQSARSQAGRSGSRLSLSGARYTPPPHRRLQFRRRATGHGQRVPRRPCP